MDRSVFFDRVRANPFGRLSAGQVVGTEAILDEWDRRMPDGDPRWLAYMLATAYHETAATMQPVKEYGGEAYYMRLYDVTGQNPTRARQYGNTTPGDGARFCGRGYVQLTWRVNYERAGEALGVDLVANPDRAMEPEIAAAIMFLGMEQGWFTGKRLADYLSPTVEDWVNARRIINGTDKASTIAAYAKSFYVSIVAASPVVPSFSGWPMLDRGDTGAAVSALQQILGAKGFYRGANDGDFGRLTDAAVRDFQRANGLVADGIVGPATVAALVPKAA